MNAETLMRQPNMARRLAVKAAKCGRMRRRSHMSWRVFRVTEIYAYRPSIHRIRLPQPRLALTQRRGIELALERWFLCAGKDGIELRAVERNQQQSTPALSASTRPCRHCARTLDRHVQREGANRDVAPDRQCYPSQCEECRAGWPIDEIATVRMTVNNDGDPISEPNREKIIRRLLHHPSRHRWHRNGRSPSSRPS